MGDIESLPFLEAIRQFPVDVGRRNCMFIHLTLVPYIGHAGELKTKPTQHSVNELRRIGIQPDMLLCRSEGELDLDIRKKIALFASLPRRGGRLGQGRRQHLQGAALVPRPGRRRLHLRALRDRRAGAPTSASWEAIDRSARTRAQRTVRIALVGKYVAARGRLPVGLRGAAPLGLPARRAGSRSTGSTPRRCDDEEAAARASPTPTASSIPGGFGGRGIEGKIRAAQRRPRAADPVPRHLPRHADRGRASSPATSPAWTARTRPSSTPRRSSRSSTSCPSRRRSPTSAARCAWAPTRSSSTPTRARARSTARPSSTSATATATRSTSACASAWRPPAWSSRARRPDERLVEIIELARPPVLRRLAVPPGVQVAARAARAAVPRVRRRRARRAHRARAGARAAPEREPAASRRRDVRRRVGGRAPPAERDVRRALRDPVSPSGEEARDARTRVTAHLRALGLEVDEDDAAGETGADCGNLARRIPRPRARRRPALRAPRHRRRTTAPSSRSAWTAAGSNASDAILGADNKAAVAVLLELARRRRASRARRSALELLFTVRRGDRAGGRQGVRRSRLRSDRSASSSTTPRRSARSSSPRRPTTASRPTFRGLAAHAGHPPRGRPLRDRSPPRARSPRCGSAASTRRRPPTSARSRGGTAAARTSSPSTARSLAEARSLDDATAEARRRRDGRPPPRRRQRARLRSATSTSIVERLFRGYRHRPARRRRSPPPSARCAPAATRPSRSSPAAASDANAFEADGLPVVNLANGTERNHEPTSA